MKIRSLGVKLFHADGQSGAQTCRQKWRRWQSLLATLGTRLKSGVRRLVWIHDPWLRHHREIPDLPIGCFFFNSDTSRCVISLIINKQTKMCLSTQLCLITQCYMFLFVRTIFRHFFFKIILKNKGTVLFLNCFKKKCLKMDRTNRNI